MKEMQEPLKEDPTKVVSNQKKKRVKKIPRKVGSFLEMEYARTPEIERI